MTSECTRRRRVTVVTFVSITLLTWGCEGGGAGRSVTTRAPADVPKLVQVAPAALTMGFALDVAGESIDLPAFSITQHPITRSDFTQCVSAGACLASKQSGCSPAAQQRLLGRRTDGPLSPQTCVSIPEAQSYCQWIGGRLPSLPEWLAAARGTTPHRFAWGDSLPSCRQHPRAAEALGAFPSESAAQEAGCVPASEGRLEVGQYPDAAAASGMQDVLLVPAELLATRRADEAAGCSPELQGCFVYGQVPGAIDAVAGLELSSDASTSGAAYVYGFRCVVGGK